MIDSATLDGRAAETCRELGAAKRVAVRCPTWLPAARERDPYDGYSLSQADFEPRDACSYLTQMGYRGAGSGRTVPFHVLLGGRCERFSLRTRKGRWPARGSGDSLRLVTKTGTGARATVARPEVVDRTSVHGSPALVLQVAPYPTGGIHGGHYAIVWNRRGAGYVLSFHLYRGDSAYAKLGIQGPKPPRRRDVENLVRAAESMVPAGEATAGSASAPRTPRALVDRRAARAMHCRLTVASRI